VAVGPETAQLIGELLSGKYPLKHLRRAQGILGLSQKYSKNRLEDAAKNANRFNQKTIQYLERVIKKNQVNHTRTGTGGEEIERGFNPHLRGIDKIFH
jgi:hypothetical protein